MRKLLAFSVLIIFFCFTSSAMAKEYKNSIFLSGSLYYTFFNMEYERRLGNFALGTEAGIAVIPEGGIARLNLLARYYVDLDFPISPFFTISPGLAFVWANDTTASSSPSAVIATAAGFNGYLAAGFELKFNAFRAALEGGYGLIAVKDIQPYGTFLAKASIGFAF